MSETNNFTVRGTFERLDTFTTKAGKEIVTLILGTNGEYPQLIPIKCFGRLVENAKACRKGDMVEVTGELGGRDWKGKVYGENKAQTIEVVGGKNGAGSRPSKPIDDQGSIPF